MNRPAVGQTPVITRALRILFIIKLCLHVSDTHNHVALLYPRETSRVFADLPGQFQLLYVLFVQHNVIVQFTAFSSQPNWRKYLFRYLGQYELLQDESEDLYDRHSKPNRDHNLHLHPQNIHRNFDINLMVISSAGPSTFLARHRDSR